MKSSNSFNRFRNGIALTALVGAGVLMAGVAPAFADPPDHAPAYGYRDHRNNQDNDRSYRERRAEEQRRERERRAEAQRERYRRSHSSTTSWAYRDSDGDGVRNGRDRYPNDWRRH